MPGPIPKPSWKRRRQVTPALGEWLEVGPLTRPVLPALPARGRGKGPWSARTKKVWAAWRADWVTNVYGPSEIAMAIELAHLWEDAVRTPSAARWGECRQWLDRLGLTMKGKRELRLYLSPTGDKAKSSHDATNTGPSTGPVSSARDRHGPLRLVDDEAAQPRRYRLTNEGDTGVTSNGN